MEVSVETVSELERTVIIGLPADEIDQKVESRLKETAKKIRLNGFRPGKVPVREVRRRFGDSVRFEVVSEAIDQSYPKALADQSLAAASQPEIEILKNEVGEKLEYKANIEVFPEIELKSLDQITVSKPVVEIVESDVDEMIEKVREQHGEWSEKGDAAAKGDQLTMDFVGTIEGEAFEGGTAEDFDILIGSGQLVPGFEDQLIGAKVDDAITVKVTFPEDYSSEELKGRDAEFAVTVKKVSSKILPEVNEEFLRKLGVQEGGVEEFREEVRKNMSRELKKSVENEIKLQVFDQLLELNPLEVPKALVRQEMERQRQESVEQMSGEYKIDKEQIAKFLPLENFKDRSERSVKLALLLADYIKTNKIEASEEQLDAKIEEMATSFVEPEMLKKYYRSNEGQMAQLRSMLVEELAIEHIMKNAQVTDNAVSYDEAIKGTFGREPESEEETHEAVAEEASSSEDVKD
jgi:trigger factor